MAAGPVTIVEVAIAQDESGIFHATSAHIPGLHMWGQTVEDICARVPEGIKVLYRLNLNLEVEIRPYTEPEQFALPIVGSCNRFAVARAA